MFVSELNNGSFPQFFVNIFLLQMKDRTSFAFVLILCFALRNESSPLAATSSFWWVSLLSLDFPSAREDPRGPHTYLQTALSPPPSSDSSLLVCDEGFSSSKEPPLTALLIPPSGTLLCSDNFQGLSLSHTLFCNYAFEYKVTPGMK